MSWRTETQQRTCWEGGNQSALFRFDGKTRGANEAVCKKNVESVAELGKEGSIYSPKVTPCGTPG